MSINPSAQSTRPREPLRSSAPDPGLPAPTSDLLQYLFPQTEGCCHSAQRSSSFLPQILAVLPTFLSEPSPPYQGNTIQLALRWVLRTRRRITTSFCVDPPTRPHPISRTGAILGTWPSNWPTKKILYRLNYESPLTRRSLAALPKLELDIPSRFDTSTILLENQNPLTLASRKEILIFRHLGLEESPGPRRPLQES